MLDVDGQKKEAVVLDLPKNTRQRHGSGVARRDHGALGKCHLITSACQQPSKSFVELPTHFQPEEAEEEFHVPVWGQAIPTLSLVKND